MRSFPYYYCTHTHTCSEVNSLLSKLSSNAAAFLVRYSLDDENTTLLHISANHPSPSILTALLKHGSEIDWQNDDGFTALHVAALWGRREVVKTLLEHGADPLIRDADGLLPVDHARNQGTQCTRAKASQLGS